MIRSACCAASASIASGSAAERFENAAPERGEDHRPDQAPDRQAGVDRSELAARDPPLDHRLDHRRDAADDVVEVESTDLGVGARLRDDELDNVRQARIAHRGRNPGQQQPKLRRDGAGATLGLGARPLDAGSDRLADDGLQKRRLVVEVEIDRRLAEPGPSRDVLEPRRRETALREQIQRGLDDFSGPRIGPPLAGRLGHVINDQLVI